MQNLQKVLAVDKENEIKTIVEEKRKIESDLKASRLENAKLKSQMEMFLSKRLNEQEINEVNSNFYKEITLILGNRSGKRPYNLEFESEN